MKDYQKDKVDRRRFLKQTSQAIAGGTVLSSLTACGPIDQEETNAITKPAKTDNTPVEETPLETERPSDIFVQIKPGLKKPGGSQQVKEPKVLTQLSIRDADDYVLLIREDDETVTARNMKFFGISSENKFTRFYEIQVTHSAMHAYIYIYICIYIYINI